MIPNSWRKTKLGVMAKTVTSGSRDWAKYYSDSGSKFIRMTNLRRDGIHLKLDDLRYVNVQSDSSDGKRTSLQYGDILISITAELGKIGFIPEDFGEAYINQHTALVRLKRSKVNPMYVAYLLSSKAMNNTINRLNDSGAKAGLNLPTIRSIPIYIPSLNEQNKIAKILSTWDKAIETTEKLVANSQQQKKALMQQLLTGKKRFAEFVSSCEVRKTRYGDIPMDWGFIPIAELANQITKKNVEKSSYPVLSCSKHEGFVDSLTYFKKKVYSDDTSNYNVVEKNTFAFPSNHIEEGSIGYQDIYDIGIVSPIYTVFKANNKVNDNYLYKLLKTEHYRQIFSAATNASVDRRGSLRWKEFSKIRVPLPSIEEQVRIADVLIIADQEIKELQGNLQFFKQEKKALMQQLLTGKLRVKVDDVNSAKGAE